MKGIGKLLKEWTLVGPFFAPDGQPLWFSFPLDAAREVPSSCFFNGQNIPVKKVTVKSHFFDLEKMLSPVVDRSSYGKRNQAIAFTSLNTSTDITITLVYDADWRAVWWLDGREVFATREGNSFRREKNEGHQVFLPLTAGEHTLAVRIISSNRGWNLRFQGLEVKPGIIDLSRIDRQAAWRDYKKTVVRLEERPIPKGFCGNLPVEKYEELMAKMGVQARWISVVNQDQGPHYPSCYLGMDSQAKPEFETNLADWVKILHKKRIAVMSWVALILARSAAKKHPDWRQEYLIIDEPGRQKYQETACCINSPYGQALIDFCIEALEKFDLDGLWFDGAAFSPVWHRPAIISCVCPWCRKKFKEDTGLEIPGRYDWSLAEFPSWVKWRYEMYQQYWQQLVDTIHQTVPEATIVFNHYHRENIGWHSAIALNPFGKDFVSGTEADSEPLRGAFYTRLMRAYGRPETEVWMALEQGRKGVRNGQEVVFNPKEILDFVLACATAGGKASVGGGDFAVEGPALRDIAQLLIPRADYLNLPTIPYIALHVSQQTETFVFGRNPDYITEDWQDYYWNSLTGWHHLLAYSGLTCDIVFDDHLQLSCLKKYPVLILPLALALTKKQYRTLMEYARNGGTLFTGPWFGLFNEWGEEKPGYPLGDRNLFPFGASFPDWSVLKNRPQLKFSGIACRVLSSFTETSREISFGQTLSRQKLGQGQIIQWAFDPGTLFRYTPVKEVVQSFKEFFLRTVPVRPLVEVLDAENLILGLFQQGKNTVVHLQQFPVPWQPENVTVRKPAVRWKTLLRWNGEKPISAKCALPEMSPELPVKKSSGYYLIEIPPFDWGQIILIGSQQR
ncbi:MAG: beta-galactosidase trimerization domain-containing protein [Candidatus Omnitrophica bacterium]|nr:beta-galactosidase trimerization domain-containing protein [Candidatus Omnitrophota bacterium]